jgi:hypothetical protein
VTTITDAPEDLQLAIREFWPESEWDHAAQIAQLESGFNPFAENDSTHGGLIPCGTVIGAVQGVTVTAEHSIGYFQVNACNFPTWEWARFFNTRHNAGTAHLLWSTRGWQPWFFSARALGLLDAVPVS